MLFPIEVTAVGLIKPHLGSRRRSGETCKVNTLPLIHADWKGALNVVCDTMPHLPLFTARGWVRPGAPQLGLGAKLQQHVGRTQHCHCSKHWRGVWLRNCHPIDLMMGKERTRQFAFSFSPSPAAFLKLRGETCHAGQWVRQLYVFTELFFRYQ